MIYISKAKKIVMPLYRSIIYIFLLFIIIFLLIESCFAAANVLLWRNKRISGSVLGSGTALWVLFEMLDYHLITLVCHILILSLAILFLWSNASNFINK